MQKTGDAGQTCGRSLQSSVRSTPRAEPLGRTPQPTRGTESRKGCGEADRHQAEFGSSKAAAGHDERRQGQDSDEGTHRGQHRTAGADSRLYCPRGFDRWFRRRHHTYLYSRRRKFFWCAHHSAQFTALFQCGLIAFARGKKESVMPIFSALISISLLRPC